MLNGYMRECQKDHKMAGDVCNSNRCMHDAQAHQARQCAHQGRQAQGQTPFRSLVPEAKQSH